MPPRFIGADPVAGLIEIKRLGELKRNLIACLERLRRIRQGHQRVLGKPEVNVVLVAEMLDPMHPRHRSRTAERRYPDMLGPQADGSRLRRHLRAAEKSGWNEVDGGGAEPARHIRPFW